MGNLNPTLWRTCKMLSGPTRIRLLRQLHQRPGLNVSELGAFVGIKRADASQELRRIQSRGLLKSARHGCPLVYSMQPDPQVASAAPLLKAIEAALKSRPSERDLEMCILTHGLAHERRIRIAQALLKSPQSLADLGPLVNIPAPSLAKHVRAMIKSGFAIKRNSQIHFSEPRHPLAHALVSLLKQAN
ncbi:MAG TPA: MarR family transcriptional regulator [Kiritimatiellia bacterium]|nr:MarR family transcriptional regulator [Kiritimatiellia bacterium]